MSATISVTKGEAGGDSPTTSAATVRISSSLRVLPPKSGTFKKFPAAARASISEKIVISKNIQSSNSQACSKYLALEKADVLSKRILNVDPILMSVSSNFRKGTAFMQASCAVSDTAID